MSIATWYLIVTKAIALLVERRAQRGFLEALLERDRRCTRWSAHSRSTTRTSRSRTWPGTRSSPRGTISARRQQAERSRLAGEFLTRSMRRVIDEDTARLESGLTVLASIGSTAPFVGLFGTVWGVYHALVASACRGQGTLDKVAGPVGEALIMTALGLAVAIPAVLAYNALRAPQPPGAGAARCASRTTCTPCSPPARTSAMPRGGVAEAAASAGASAGGLSMAFGGFNKERRQPPMAEINMIPLIDVMLVLLVIFIITAPLLTHAVKIDLPKAASQPNLTKPDNIQLAIDGDGRVFWNGEPLDRAPWRERLAAAASCSRSPKCISAPTATSRYQSVAEVMADAASVGLTRIGFVTDPEQRELGAMGQMLVVTLREGIEAFLIVAIAAAYLRKTGRAALLPAVWWGTAPRAVLSRWCWAAGSPSTRCSRSGRACSPCRRACW